MMVDYIKHNLVIEFPGFCWYSIKIIIPRLKRNIYMIYRIALEEELM